MICFNLLPKSPTVWSIYRLTSPSGKVYIGQTVKSVRRRFSDHVSNANKKANACPRLEAAIRKYGRDAFQVEHLCSAPTKAEADYLETQLIAEHDSRGPEGYNVALGGRGHLKEFCKRGHLLAETRNSVGDCGECAKLRNKQWEDKHRVRINAEARQEYSDPIIRARRKAAGCRFRANNADKIKADAKARFADPAKLGAKRRAANRYARRRRQEINSDPVARLLHLAKRREQRKKTMHVSQ